MMISHIFRRKLDYPEDLLEKSLFWDIFVKNVHNFIDKYETKDKIQEITVVDIRRHTIDNIETYTFCIKVYIVSGVHDYLDININVPLNILQSLNNSEILDFLIRYKDDLIRNLKKEQEEIEKRKSILNNYIIEYGI
jgi:hypothetical protein